MLLFNSYSCVYFKLFFLVGAHSSLKFFFVSRVKAMRVIPLTTSKMLMKFLINVLSDAEKTESALENSQDQLKSHYNL